MASSTLSKSIFGALGTSGTVATPGVAYGLYRGNAEYQVTKTKEEQKKQWDSDKSKRLTEVTIGTREVGLGKHDHSGFFSDSVCLPDSAKSVLTNVSPRRLFSYSKQKIKLGNNDFLSDVENTKSGCFNIQTKEDSGSIVGFMELIAETNGFLMALQSDFNLAKGSPGSSHYFMSRLSFLRKVDSSWELDKAFAWKEGGIKNKKTSEIFNFAIEKNQKVSATLENKSLIITIEKPEEGLLSEKIGFKNVKLWSDPSDFSFLGKNNKTEIVFLYKDKKWYKDHSKVGLEVEVSGNQDLKILKQNWIFDSKLNSE